MPLCCKNYKSNVKAAFSFGINLYKKFFSGFIILKSMTANKHKNGTSLSIMIQLKWGTVVFNKKVH